MAGVTPAAPSEKLPPGLSRLPADKLLRVHQALVELEQAGLSEVADLAHLSKVVRRSDAELDAYWKACKALCRGEEEDRQCEQLTLAR